MPDTDPSNPGRDTSAEAGAPDAGERSSPAAPAPSVPGEDPKRVPRYLELDPELLPSDSSWSNDPKLMKMETYFSLDPDNFYLWNEIDAAMWAFRKPNNGSLKLEDVVKKVRTSTYSGQDVIQQYRSELGSWGQG
ncbi:hypothetical protein TGAM01_v203285 [Trichoderma gamsii]|uniref:Uncharacterized protein n=1 Tax=Trichoderma gamsii TaxID=398673 RepID=A0A2P4ZV41_9HYPO|nr:hypothetical protein TGAM01_v203285 [Trichoderma gamsii]PON28148.1 hypothetical protein TGAM01_v203285 [Trichoderma gamsii]